MGWGSWSQARVRVKSWEERWRGRRPRKRRGELWWVRTWERRREARRRRREEEGGREGGIRLEGGSQVLLLEEKEEEEPAEEEEEEEEGGKGRRVSLLRWTRSRRSK